MNNAFTIAAIPATAVLPCSSLVGAIPNCLTRRSLVTTVFMLRHVRNCRHYYCSFNSSHCVLITARTWR